MGRMAGNLTWFHLGEISFKHGQDNLAMLKSNLRLNQVMLGQVTKVFEKGQAQIYLKGVEVLCDVPNGLKVGSKILVQVKEIAPQVVLKLLPSGANSQPGQELKTEQLQQLLKSFQLPQTSENLMVVQELFHHNEVISAENILQIKHDLASLLKAGVLIRGESSPEELQQLIRYLVFLRSVGLACSVAGLKLAQKAFAAPKNLADTIQALMGAETSEMQPMKKALRALIPKLSSDNLETTIASQLKNLGWFYEHKLWRGLNEQNDAYRSDIKHLLIELAGKLQAKDDGPLAQLWETLTAHSLKNLSEQQTQKGDAYFPLLFEDAGQLKELHLRFAFNKEGEIATPQAKAKERFCLAMLLDMSRLGSVMLVAEVGPHKDISLNFRLASRTIKKLFDSHASQLEERFEALGYSLKKWSSSVKSVSTEQFMEESLKTGWRVLGKVDFVV